MTLAQRIWAHLKDHPHGELRNKLNAFFGSNS